MNRATAGVDYPSNSTTITIGEPMRHLFAVITAALLLLTSLYSQEPKRFSRTISADDAVIIRELGAVIIPKANALVIDIILGNNEKAAADIQKDDLILMANGKKVKGVNELRELYDQAAVGQEFKLGVQRGENLFIASFTKKSEEELNKDGGHGGMVIHMEKNEGETVLPALGLVLATKGKYVTVSKTLPTVTKNFTSFIPHDSDLVLSINGTPVSTAEEFDEAYMDLEEGESVTIEFSRDGKTSSATLKKPKPMNRMIIRK